MANPLLEYINKHKQDAIIYKAKHLLSEAGDDEYQKSFAMDEIQKMLAVISNEILLESYTKKIAALSGIKFNTLTKTVKDVKEKVREAGEEQHVPEGKKALPKWVNKERAMVHGFDWRLDVVNKDNTGIYFTQFSNQMERRTNFTIKPIVHILSQNPDENRRITEMNNGYTSHVFELPSKAFISLDAFETLLMDQGTYFLDGMSKGDLNKLKIYYLSHYPTGYELKNLGWQAEGFFAFSNFIYKQGLIPFDDYGLADIDGIKYLSMGSSNILKNLRKGTDTYKNDKLLRYDESPISFGEWSTLLQAVYKEKGMMGIAWCLLAANRDIVAGLTSYCPIPYCYGAAQSGKSQFVASLCALFFNGLKPFALNQGTEPSFWNYAGRFTNVLMPFNEFDENGIDPRRVKAFKSMADIEGRDRMVNRNKAETQEPTSTPILAGQYLATMDDGAVLGRSIPEKFVENNNRTQEEIDVFNQLKAIEKKGISSLLCGILGARSHVEQHYQVIYNQVAKELKNDFIAEGFTPKNRVVQNYTIVLTMVKLYEDRLDLSFTYDQFYQYCKAQILKLNNLIGESNSLGEFWKAIESLADHGMIEPGWDFKVETHTEVKSLIGEKSSKVSRSFEKPTRLLFLRLNNVYALFAKEKRAISGKASINVETLKTYLQEQPYYVGAQSNGNFKSKKFGYTKGTSSMVINYDMLNAMDIHLERQESNDDQRELIELTGKVRGRDAEVQVILNKEKVVFTLLQDQSYVNDQNFTVSNNIYTKCFYHDQAVMWALQIGAVLKVTGMLSITKRGDKDWRNMEVLSLEVVEHVPGAAPPAERFTPTPIPRQADMFDRNNKAIDTTERDPEF